jgi:SagB-type dehydrogenase family enzyme
MPTRGRNASAGATPARPGRVTPDTVTLAPPRPAGPLSVEEALSRRRSIRALSEAPLAWDQIGQLCWAAQGVTGAGGLRAAPSAGATYPLELYVATHDGLFRYECRRHEAVRVLTSDVRRELRRASLDQASLEAGAVFAVTAVPPRTAARYGERATRYVHFEAGHAAENLLLEAAALGLGAVLVGAFDDRRVQAILALRAPEVPLCLIPVGRPA